MDDSLFPDDPDDTRTAILKATFDALVKHGYSSLTIKRINEEFLKSEALIYHHYDSKDELLLDLLDYLLERFAEREIPAADAADPETELRNILDHILVRMEQNDRRDGLTTALIELQAQAAHDEAYRAQFTQTRARFHEALRETVSRGVDAGAFRPVDAERVADLLVTVVSGVMFERATIDDLRPVRDELDRYIDDVLVAED
jgi:AcrR family transcriptional regulator